MTKPATILIIDDETMVRRSIAAYLEDSGFQVVEAANGHEGLDLLARVAVDLVVTDLRMPGMDGLDIIDRLQVRSPQTPVIVVTGTADVTATDSVCRRGAVACFFKPINDLRVLETAIGQALRARADSNTEAGGTHHEQ